MTMRDKKYIQFIRRMAGGIVFAAGGLLLGILLVLLGILYGIISLVIGLLDCLLRKTERHCNSREETLEQAKLNEIKSTALPA